MVDRDDALQALGVICNATVTGYAGAGSAAGNLLSISNFIHTVLYRIAAGAYTLQLNDNEFFAPEFNYDFTNLKDTETYYRGGEVYERPCGWYRLGLKVLDKYDGNAWLGSSYRSTQSQAGEWPVSYHGTSSQGANGIIAGVYKVGPRDLFGPGIYSTPFISVADAFARTFTSDKTGKKFKVILQNRINPLYRVKKHYDRYWLVEIPKGLPNVTEHVMVQRAIRPYGLLVKEIY